ncbi:MAG: class I SAM-dependent methyltransferase [Calditrichaeota bacterium]|nr:MAG: class I SAM-dependent methyltransferase [Calditrichota bacterium]
MDNLLMYEVNKNILLENVDDTLPAKILNRITHNYRSNFANNPKNVISERIIEYPILFQHLRKDVTRILDFGCVEDLLPIHLASLGYKVTGMDFRPYPFKHKNFNFIQQDILSWEPPKEEFDTVISISTIEHVGLSTYGDPESNDGDKVAVKKLMHSLRKGGDFIITLPAGKRCIKRGMRIYDRQAIEELVPNIKTLKMFYKPHRYGDWQETTDDVISSLVWDNYNTTSPAQGVGFIVSEKS